MLDLVLSYKRRPDRQLRVENETETFDASYDHEDMLHNQGCSDIKIRSVPRGYEKVLTKPPNRCIMYLKEQPNEDI